MKPPPATAEREAAWSAAESWPACTALFWQTTFWPVLPVHMRRASSVRMKRPSLPRYAAFGGCCTTVVGVPSSVLYSAVKVSFPDLPIRSARSVIAETLSTVCLTWLMMPQPSAPAPSADASTTVRIREPARCMPPNVGPVTGSGNELSAGRPVDRAADRLGGGALRLEPHPDRAAGFQVGVPRLGAQRQPVRL